MYNGQRQCILVLVVAAERSSSFIKISSIEPSQYSPDPPQGRDSIVLVEEIEPLASLHLQFVFEASGVSIGCQTLQIFVVDAEMHDGNVVVHDREHVDLCQKTSVSPHAMIPNPPGDTICEVVKLSTLRKSTYIIPLALLLP